MKFLGILGKVILGCAFRAKQRLVSLRWQGWLFFVHPVAEGSQFVLFHTAARGTLSATFDALMGISIIFG